MTELNYSEATHTELISKITKGSAEDIKRRQEHLYRIITLLRIDLNCESAIRISEKRFLVYIKGKYYFLEQTVISQMDYYSFYKVNSYEGFNVGYTTAADEMLPAEHVAQVIADKLDIGVTILMPLLEQEP